MKAALNGVLNCSIRDGWWDEMSNGSNGWDIPSFDEDERNRDRREASATFELLEREIVPLFHDRGDSGVPHGWIDRLTENWASLGWRVIAGRMVREYTTELYEPAASANDRVVVDDGDGARELAAWRAGVSSVWDQVSVKVDLDSSDLADGRSGATRTVCAIVDPGSLRLDELVVQAVHGPLGADGDMRADSVEVVSMAPGDDGVFRADVTPTGAGAWGLVVRALPTHSDLSHLAETGLVTVG
jgi:starch phosphorylase